GEEQRVGIHPLALVGGGVGDQVAVGVAVLLIEQAAVRAVLGQADRRQSQGQRGQHHEGCQEVGALAGGYQVHLVLLLGPGVASTPSGVPVTATACFGPACD